MRVWKGFEPGEDKGEKRGGRGGGGGQKIEKGAS